MCFTLWTKPRSGTTPTSGPKGEKGRKTLCRKPTGVWRCRIGSNRPLLRNPRAEKKPKKPKFTVCLNTGAISTKPLPVSRASKAVPFSHAKCTCDFDKPSWLRKGVYSRGSPLFGKTGHHPKSRGNRSPRPAAQNEKKGRIHAEFWAAVSFH